MRRLTILGLSYLALLTVALVIPADAEWHAHRVNRWLALEDDVSTRRMLADVALNVAIFLPIGLWLERELRRRGVPPARRWLLAVGLAGSYSFTMETIQYLLAWRASGILDVIANTAGAATAVALSRRHAVTRVTATTPALVPSPRHAADGGGAQPEPIA